MGMIRLRIHLGFGTKVWGFGFGLGFEGLGFRFGRPCALQIPPVLPKAPQRFPYSPTGLSSFHVHVGSAEFSVCVEKAPETPNPKPHGHTARAATMI